MQEDALVLIEEMFLRYPYENFLTIVRYVKMENSLPVPSSTLRKWWKKYEATGLLPYEQREVSRRIKKLTHRYKRTSLITDDIVETLREIISEHPEYYLDEIQVAVCIRSKVFIAQSTLWKVLKQKLNYSLQVCHECAKQRNEGHRMLYRAALNNLVGNAEQVVFIDETHKDKAASRRRRAWGRLNSGGVKLERWFRQEARYTMIAGFNVDGFVMSTIECVMRDEISQEGAAGTVNADHFEDWVEHYLCPILGDYSKGEKNSIVVMDNASTHLGVRVGELIRATGAVLLYTAPYSPDLNPIELGFNLYKAHLKRLGLTSDWYVNHLEALDLVNRDDAIQEFRRCGVPKSDEIMTTKELMMLGLIVIALSLINM